jgi:hypothetical protein
VKLGELVDTSFEFPKWICFLDLELVCESYELGSEV